MVSEVQQKTKGKFYKFKINFFFFKKRKEHVDGVDDKLIAVVVVNTVLLSSATAPISFSSFISHCYLCT